MTHESGSRRWEQEVGKRTVKAEICRSTPSSSRSTPTVAPNRAELTDAVLQLAAVELKETWKSAQTFKLENHTHIDTPCSGLQTSVSVLGYSGIFVQVKRLKQSRSWGSEINEPFQESEEVSNPKRNYPNFRGGGWFMK
ncbi:hypothetical protein GGX14DRAFT_408635 [Mycena pura]|uniref:Uncharacterized protein n=1 Tax=Mycena pura TaxID=153505 RepID=A0AAD6UPR3_9AGAR|nr:hypothetical protein GGX14DRAFT_408635 [Mycena pura]